MQKPKFLFIFLFNIAVTLLITQNNHASAAQSNASSLQPNVSPVAQSEKALNSISSQYSEFESSLKNASNNSEFQAIVTQMNSRLELLKRCEKEANSELETIKSVLQSQSDTSNDTKAVASSKEGELAEREANAKRVLLECRYWHLRISQLRELGVKQLSQEKLSNYFTRTPIYFKPAEESTSIDDAKNQEKSLTKPKYDKLWEFIGFHLALMLLMFMVVTTSNYLLTQKDNALKHLSSLITLSISLAVAFTGRVLFDERLPGQADHAWVIGSYVLIALALVQKTSFFKKLILFTLSSLIVISSHLMLTEVIWQASIITHAIAIGVLALSLFFLSTILLKGKSKFVVMGLLGLFTILEFSEYHFAAHQALTFIVIMMILFSIFEVTKIILSALEKLLIKFQLFFLNQENPNSPSGLALTRNIAIFFVMLYGSFSLLKHSGLSDSFTSVLKSFFYDGFSVGTIQININDILAGLLIFGIILIAASIIRQKIESPKAGQESDSSQAAKGSLFWYGSILTAGLVALSISGFSVQNLALVAGAFSVGIGFGLQNIVSNFVSGIILLIERPVKPGDWVIIGGTEGLIQSISIRATQIRTFDKADILIPNTEFISNQVTNLMLGDKIGRLKVNVGVAYGSDTQKVLNVLKEIVDNHAEILHDDPQLSPTIIFKQFGESSLDFEVRGFLSDISRVFAVKSELHFKIDQAFRENNIEIPFPQRDLHVRSWGDLEQQIEGRKERDDDKS